MKKFERTLANFVNIWIALTVFIMSAAFALDGPFPQWGYFWILLTLSLLVPVLSTYTITCLTVDKSRNVVVVEWRKWFIIHKVEEYPITTIKAEISNEINRIGRKHDVLRVFANKQLIGEMPTNFTGWHKEIVEAFIKEINQ